MLVKFKTFLANESGAITVDWIVLTAACVALGLLVIMMISGSVRDNSTEVSAIMEAYEINDDFDTEAEIAALQQAANAAFNADPDPDPAVTN